jgi:hypothetical protein
MNPINNSPVILIIGCACVYPALAFVAGILVERYRRRFRIVRVEPQEGKEV